MWDKNRLTLLAASQRVDWESNLDSKHINNLLHRSYKRLSPYSRLELNRP